MFMGPTVDSRTKIVDAGIPPLQTAYEIKAAVLNTSHWLNNNVTSLVEVATETSW